MVTDSEPARAAALAKRHNADVCADWREVVERNDLDACVVATYPDSSCLISAAALRAGRHVLCEKPLGRSALEARVAVAASVESGRLLKVGFNHRHHPAIARAHELLREGRFGELFAIRAAYGHGGRPGYDKEWRADATRAGGGELLDQGSHLVDLVRWFMGDIRFAFGGLSTRVWPIQVEDNAFAMLFSDTGTASIHASWTQWKNLFRFEVLGTEGYAVIEGLGASYGVETLRIGRRGTGDSPVPIEETISYDGEDISWSAEWSEFRESISQGRQPIGNGLDGLEVARIIDAIYRSHAERRLTIVT